MLLGQLPARHGRIHTSDEIMGDYVKGLAKDSSIDHEGCFQELRDVQSLDDLTRGMPAGVGHLDVLEQLFQAQNALKPIPITYKKWLSCLKEDAMKIGMLAVTWHDDMGVSPNPERWLFILQVGKGYTFEVCQRKRRVCTSFESFVDSQRRLGKIDQYPLKAGQVIAFNEERPHRVVVDRPDLVKKRLPNVFITAPNPYFLG